MAQMSDEFGMKNTKEIFLGLQEELKNRVSVSCDYKLVPGCVFERVEPFISIDHSCDFCKCKEGYIALMKPGDKKKEYVWMCANPNRCPSHAKPTKKID